MYKHMLQATSYKIYVSMYITLSIYYENGRKVEVT